MLIRYWITFEEKDRSQYLGGAFGFGVGVTAYDIDDAKALVAEKIFKGDAVPEIKNIVVDVKFDDLEESHVRPNMGVIVNRGIWFPKGFE